VVHARGVGHRRRLDIDDRQAVNARWRALQSCIDEPDHTLPFLRDDVQSRARPTQDL
jgi:hypothetical protein